MDRQLASSVAVIKKRIETSGIKQNFVASQAGMRADTFNAVLAGKRKMTADELINVSRVLGLSLSDFLPRPA